jgi:hypothetical protein
MAMPALSIKLFANCAVEHSKDRPLMPIFMRLQQRARPVLGHLRPNALQPRAGLWGAMRRRMAPQSVFEIHVGFL